MFVNKINVAQSLGFRGYQHIKNDVGETIMKFNYPYDSDTETCEIQIFKVRPTSKYNYRIDYEPIASFDLKPDGVDVNLQDITNLDRDEAFAYKYVRKDKKTGKVISEGADTGVKMREQDGEYVFRVSDGRKYKPYDVHALPEKDENGNIKKNDKGEVIYQKVYYESNEYDDSESNYKYTLVTRKGTTPMVQGAGYLGIPDSMKPGVMYRGFSDSNTGELYFDAEYQKNAEKMIKSFSNSYGGTFAAFQEMIPYFKENGYKMLFSTPIANGDDVSSHSYWNKNNMQIASSMGNIDNFSSFMREMYRNGRTYVYDGTFTSEGLEGIHFQYALRWANKNPQTYYWFRMSGLKNSNLGLGVVPNNADTIRLRLVNAPYLYEQKEDGTITKKANPDYDKHHEIQIQVYDSATHPLNTENMKKMDRIARLHESLKKGNELSVNSHDDTNMCYTFTLDNFNEYEKNIETLNDYMKRTGKKVNLDSSEATLMLAQFSNFKIDKKTEGGFVTWDANTDMVKMNYGISGYDEKNLQAMVNRSQRYHEQQLMVRGTKEVQDITVQAGKYWTGKVKDIQTFYTAKTLGTLKNLSELKKLIAEEKLPEETDINETTFENIMNGQYMLSPKGLLDKDSVTIKALMRLPLDTLEFGENTVGVLSTSFFSNRATTDEQVGISRYELMKQNNPHLVDNYGRVYNKVNDLFKNELREFAHSVIEKVNKSSNEKLLDSNGNYTEYGEYVMELVGQDIAKYALLKSLSGDSFKTKTLPDGSITYDYDKIKEATTLKALGIEAHNPEEEALVLERKIEKGLKKISSDDISYVANSINQRIAGTDTQSFRLAEALVDRAGLGLNWRLDAAKDVMDMDAIRNKDNSFDDNWNEVIKFWSKFVQGVKTENKNSYLVAEITDICDLMRDTTGFETWPYNGDTNIGGKFNGEPDAMVKFFNETGITSEAGYSYFFTDLLKVFAPEFESGQGISSTHDSFKDRLDLLIQTRSIDYLRNMYTFIGNHDKPRMIHGLAVDMRLFHSPLLMNFPENKADYSREHDQRLKVIQTMSGVTSLLDTPIELRLNVDNNEYFKTISARAVAQSKLIMEALDDVSADYNSDDIRLIKQALVDLANGNYLMSNQTEALTRISINEISTLENAFNEFFKMAENHGLKLSENEKKTLIENAIKEANLKLEKDDELVRSNDDANQAKYLVHGDFDWANANKHIGEQNRKYLEEVMGTSSDCKKYDLYSLQLARLMKDSILDASKNIKNKEPFFAAARDFVKKYDRTALNSARKDFKRVESAQDAMKKNGYAARDIQTAISMALKQAEFKSGKTIENKEKLIDNVYKAATEPAVVKASMIMEFLKGLPGIATMYGGDELGMTGLEEKAKNVYLQNRNALPWSQLEGDNLIAGYRKSIMASMNGAIVDRKNPELAAMNNGTPYSLDVCAHNKNRDEVRARIEEINKLLEGNPDKNTREKLEKEQRELTKDLAKISFMMQSANGDVTVTLFNADGINFNNRHDYFKEHNIHSEADRKRFFNENNIESINPQNKYVPIQKKSEVDYILLTAGVALPVGTVFTNANAKDKTKYIVQKFGDKLGIAKQGGGKIIMDGLTSKHGVMILKHLAFRGKQQNRQYKTYFNKQYNIVSNPYMQDVTAEEGQKLSLISR